MVQLVAYVIARPNGCTKTDVRTHVPGYQGLSESALEKRLQRDRHVLGDAWGIDIEYAERTWTYSIRPPFFTAKERTALITAAAMVDVDGAGDDELPGELGTAVSQARALIVVRVHGRVVELREAIAQCQTVQFRFNGTVRTVDPYVVGMWRHSWYVVGDEHETGIRKKYNLDKIESEDDSPAIEAPCARSDAISRYSVRKLIPSSAASAAPLTGKRRRRSACISCRRRSARDMADDVRGAGAIRAAAAENRLRPR